MISKEDFGAVYINGILRGSRYIWCIVDNCFSYLLIQAKMCNMNRLQLDMKMWFFVQQESEITHGAVGHAASEMYTTNDYLEIRLFKIASRTYKYTGVFDILVQ